MTEPLTELSGLLTRLDRTRRRLADRTGRARELFTTGQALQASIAELTQRKYLDETSAVILTNISEQRQNALQAQIEALVTQGLQTIIDPALSFQLVAKKVGDTRAEIDFVVRTTFTDGTVLDTDVLSARGGGLAQIIGFLLQFIVKMLDPRYRTSPLWLDEPLGAVSAEYAPRMAAFIADIVAKVPGAQVVMVTHSHPEVYAEHADRRYRLAQRDGASYVTTF